MNEKGIKQNQNNIMETTANTVLLNLNLNNLGLILVTYQLQVWISEDLIIFQKGFSLMLPHLSFPEKF